MEDSEKKKSVTTENTWKEETAMFRTWWFKVLLLVGVAVAGLYIPPLPIDQEVKKDIVTLYVTVACIPAALYGIRVAWRKLVPEKKYFRLAFAVLCQSVLIASFCYYFWDLTLRDWVMKMVG